MAGLDRLTALAGDWRATYQLRGDPAGRMTMFNVDPGGQEALAVHAEYERA
jgi:hypothetical protein